MKIKFLRMSQTTCTCKKNINIPEFSRYFFNEFNVCQFLFYFLLTTHHMHVYVLNNFFPTRCCINEKCTKKKINEMMTCTNCHIKYSDTSAGHAVVVKLLIKNSRNNMQIFTAFTDAIEQLFTSMGKTANFSDAETLLQTFKELLPVPVKYTPKGDKISSLQAV